MRLRPSLRSTPAALSGRRLPRRCPKATKPKHVRVIGLEVSPALRWLLAAMKLRSGEGNVFVFGGDERYPDVTASNPRHRLALDPLSAFVDRPYERLKDLKDIAHILNEYPSLDDDGLFSDEVRAMRLELGPARAFVLGVRLREMVDLRDREVVEAFFRTIAEDVHGTRFVETSPWRHDEDDLRKKIDALRSAFDAAGVAPD